MSIHNISSSELIVIGSILLSTIEDASGNNNVCEDTITEGIIIIINIPLAVDRFL